MRIEDLTEEQTKMDSPEFKKLLTLPLLQLGRLYSSNGFDLRIVGGAVRDLLLKKDPKDIDLASDATPEESLAMLKGEGIRVIETGLQHGTITAVIDGEDFEITTLRIDTDQDGRHATVQYTKDWEVDAERRDLTFNAMSLDLDGNLYDYYGGQEDLKSDKAKFVGDADARMKEDYLRILRYFRFQGRTVNPNFDQETIDAISDNAEGLKQISGERIWMEMAKILSGDHTIKLLQKMVETGVDKAIGLPMGNFKELARVRKHINSAPIMLTTLLKNEADVEKLSAKWKLKNEDRDLIRFLVMNRGHSFNFDDAKRMWTNPKVKDEYVLSLAHYLGKSDIATDLQSNIKPVFPVTGQDLLDAGMDSGPEVGKVLKRLEQKWKDGGYEATREELLGDIDE